MSDYRCSNCKKTYSHTEYMGLDTVSRVTDDPNDEYGVETVCECGKNREGAKEREVAKVEGISPNGSASRPSPASLVRGFSEVSIGDCNRRAGWSWGCGGVGQLTRVGVGLNYGSVR